MKNSFKIIIIILGFVALGLVLHFELFNNFSLIKDFNKNSVLSINTRRGSAKVWINGQDYGQTPQSISHLPDGEYLIELERESENNLYPKQSFYIELHQNTEAIVDIELAPGDFKSGHILYYSPAARTLKKVGSVTIRSNLHDFDVKINGERVGRDDLIGYQLNPNEYEVEVTAYGYESLEFPVIIRDGYNLNVRVYLLPIPVNFENAR
jgi:hypothetical protein